MLVKVVDRATHAVQLQKGNEYMRINNKKLDIIKKRNIQVSVFFDTAKSNWSKEVVFLYIF